MSDLPDPGPPPPRGFPLWQIAVLVSLIVLCLVGLAIQLASWRSGRADRTHTAQAVSDGGVLAPGTVKRTMAPNTAHPVPNGETVAPNTAERMTPSSTGDLPAYGEYVYVEELPEALTKVAPEYPDEARELGQEGTVVVQALIGKDGMVKDTKVARSIPELDDAAVSAVERWTFKPAQAKGEPVAVWVAVPVKFTLR